MKQTAVEWLFDNLNITGGSDDMKAFDQAKAMEKEQIMDAFNFNNIKWTPKFDDEGNMSITNEIICNNSEQYYNETFKSE